MMTRNIELKCQTYGFAYGDIAEVGTGDGKISKAMAEVLVKEGNAIEVNPKVVAGDKELLAEINRLKAELASVEKGGDMIIVQFTKAGTVNGEKYKRGDELRVSESIANDLIEVQKCAKEKVIKTVKES